MFKFDTIFELLIAIVISLANTVILCCLCYKILHVFQLGNYRVRNLVRWVVDRRSKFYSRLFALSFLSFGSMFIFNIIFLHFSILNLSFLGLIFYFYLAIVLILNVQAAPVKVPLRSTRRIRRLLGVLFLVNFFVSFTIIWLGSFTVIDVGGIPQNITRMSLIAFIPLALPWIVILCNALLWPVEASIKTRYIRRANRKLERPEYENLIRIGITGSWGKTSCKNILTAMLREKYIVTASPHSFNTPMGYTKTVLNVLKPGDEVLILEMGARHLGDIKYLAGLFKPQHGIITGIGTQHLETFRTLESIKLAKTDLIRALPENGIGVINGDSEKCKEFFVESKGNIQASLLLSSSKEDPDSAGFVKDVSITSDGCEFKIVLKSEKPFLVRTKLLGKHNIENILMCAIMAHKLGVTSAQIAEAVSKLEPTPHRLELIKGENGVFILDDSYNASVNGTKAALGVLKLFKGKKIIMTPGLIELGMSEEEENFRFGKRIAEVANHVIIIGELHKENITDGLASADYKQEKIHYAKTVEDAKSIYVKLLKAGDVLLIANDLPDNYA